MDTQRTATVVRDTATERGRGEKREMESRYVHRDMGMGNILLRPTSKGQSLTKGTEA